MTDGLQEILFTLRQNKLRTALTAFGVFWGILMLTFMLGAGKGMQNGAFESFGSEVLDFIVVFSGTTSQSYQGMGVGRYIQLTKEDVTSIKQQIPNVRFIASENQMGNADIIYEKKMGNYNVLGIPDEYFRIKESVPFNFGRKMNSFDQDEYRKVCELGTAVVEKIFGKDADPVGKYVKVNGVVLKVVGVFYDKGNRGRDSERIYIPATTYEKIYGAGNKIQSMWLRPTQGTDGFELEKKVVELLRKRHTVSPEDKRAIRSFNMAEPAKMVNGLFVAINAIIWFVGLGTLTAGIVGISNIMIITVKERTREIGIRKALGATPFNIVSTLLMESILVTAVAGYAGLVLGVGFWTGIDALLTKANANLPFFSHPEVNFQAAITAVVLLIVAGAFAGLAPALKAARIPPIEAMRAD